jgi:hypothetical protein
VREGELIEEVFTRTHREDRRKGRKKERKKERTWVSVCVCEEEAFTTATSPTRRKDN